MSSRPFDIVVWGATGFTGTFIAQYLATNAPDTVKWAIAGRSREKLDDLRARLVRDTPALKDRLQVLIGNSSDQASLNRLAESTRVIISAVGPFLLHGVPLVRACVANRCDYVDTAGEPLFHRACIDEFSDSAEKNEVLIVPGCAFDSLPSDLGALMMCMHVRKAFGLPTRRIRAYLLNRGLRPSGGTLASVVALFETSASARGRIADPYVLGTGLRGPDPPDSVMPRRAVPPLRGWTAFFPLSHMNARVVRRSWSLLQQQQQQSAGGSSTPLQTVAYGPNFSYQESALQNGLLRALLSTLVTLLGMFLLWLRPTRALLQRFVLPRAGEGPPPQQLANSSAQLRLVAEADAPPNQKAPVALGVVNIEKDPGYIETAKMVSEAALCLVLERASLPSKGGVRTPATAFGIILISRLRRAGIKFDVVERFVG